MDKSRGSDQVFHQSKIPGQGPPQVPGVFVVDELVNATYIDSIAILDAAGNPIPQEFKIDSRFKGMTIQNAGPVNSVAVDICWGWDAKQNRNGIIIPYEEKTFIFMRLKGWVDNPGKQTRSLWVLINVPPAVPFPGFIGDARFKIWFW